MKSKYCSKCKEVKSVDEFYIYKSRNNNIGVYCKACEIEYVYGKAAKRSRERYHSDPEYRSRCLEKSRKAYLEKTYIYKAHNLVRKAIMEGKLKKMVCRVCGSNKTQAHHPDYSKPLEVIWLCLSHHRMANIGTLDLKFSSN